MTRRAFGLIAVAATVTLTGVAVAVIMTRGQPPLIDLARDPETTFATVSFEVGASYTLGSMAIPGDVLRPVTVTEIRVVHAAGVETLGTALFDADAQPTGIGLVPGWPPEGVELTDLRTNPIAWPGQVAIVVGLRTLEPTSGLRGVLVRWVDATGKSGERVFDLAVLTCAPNTCEVDPSNPDSLLNQLGLHK